MLIHVNDAVTLQGARTLRRPLAIPYGIHSEYELSIVTGHDNRPVDIESRGCVKWTLTVTPSPENPTKVLAYAVFADNIAAGNSLRFDFAATSVEMYKHVAGNPATPAVLQLQGFTDDVSPATVIITLPVALVTSAQQRLPVDLSTALMQELQLAVSTVGAAQRSVSKSAADALAAGEGAAEALRGATAERVLAQSYARGGTGTRPGEDEDNAMYYMEEARKAAEDSGATIKPIVLDNPPTTSTKGGVGQIAVANGRYYVCVDADEESQPPVYTWEEAVNESQRNVPNGFAGLDSNGKVPSAQLPAMDYVPVSEKGQPDGVATLDSNGKVPSAQLPAIPTALADLTEDTGHMTVTEAEKTAWNAKQDAITPDNKIPYSNISGTPDIPTKTSDLQNDSGFQTAQQVQSTVSTAVSTKADQSALEAHVGDTTVHVTANEKAAWNSKQDAITSQNKIPYANISGTPDLKPVATSGSYNDLTDKPVIPAEQVQANWNETDTTSKAYIRNKPSLAAVATSGNYNDLTNKPAIPTQASDIGAIPASEKGQPNGVAALNANGEIDTAQIPGMPTKVSDLQNDLGFQTAQQVQSTVSTAVSGKADQSALESHVNNTTVHVTSQEKTAWDAKSDFSGNYEDLSNKPDIPDSAEDVGAIPVSEKGAANGVATLDAGSKVPSSQLPVGGVGVLGAVQVAASGAGGISVSNGTLSVAGADSADIAARTQSSKPVTPANLNTAVTAAITDANHMTLNASQQATAQSVFNVPDISGTGASLGLSIDPSTYVMTLTLKNPAGDTLDTKTVDLPLETMVVSASYANGVLTLTLQSGATTDIDISALVDGLIPASEKGAVNGVATLGSDGKVPSSQLPAIPTALSQLTSDADHRTVTDAEKTAWSNKSDFSGDYNDLTNKPTIPPAQVQADWNEADTTSKAYIQNKPTIPDAQVQADWTQSDTTAKDYIKNKPALAAVATSGSYDDLSDKPTAAGIGAIPATEKGAVNGVATLGSDGKVSASQLPEGQGGPEPIIGTGAPDETTEGTPGQIYVDSETDKVYFCVSVTNEGTEAEPSYVYGWVESGQGDAENKADKVSGNVNGHVAGLDSEGNLMDGVIPLSDIARKDGYYAADRFGAYSAEQLIDPNASPYPATFGHRTSAGSVSISDDSTGIVESLQGTTQVRNQLVGETGDVTSRSDGRTLVVEDAVGGNLSRLEVTGGCVVHNQLVKDASYNTATGTGRVNFDDGIAGNALALKMVAPRSVVVNQLVQNGNFSDGTTNWSGSRFTITAQDNVLTGVLNTGSLQYMNVSQMLLQGIPASHVALIHVEIKIPYNDNAVIRFGAGDGGTFYASRNIACIANTWGALNVKTNALSDIGKILFIYPSNTNYASWQIDDTIQIRNVKLVDLTQYFNGDTTLIDSITSWDDLVAYDPRFASYVAYNTGTVAGVRPTVKVNHTTDVACPDDLFAVGNAADEYEAVAGVTTHKMAKSKISDLTWGRFQYASGFYYFRCASAPTVASAKIIADRYIKVATGTQNLTDKTITGYKDSPLILVRDDAYETVEAWLAAVGDSYVYYELATPTTSAHEPAQLPTLDVYNSAVQTDGGRKCGLTMEYNGRAQTVQLTSSHTYIYRHPNPAGDSNAPCIDTIVTGQSSLTVECRRDQLVDLTRFYNGDASKIAKITSWRALSARFPRYRQWLPENTGTVEPEYPVVRKPADNYAYGILYDPSVSPSACRWMELGNDGVHEVGSFLAFRRTPCHELLRCVMDDLATRHVNYYLDDETSSLKYNGTRNGVTSDGSASVLTGADGDVMSEFPIGYSYMDEDFQDTGKILWLVNDKPFWGTRGPAEIDDFFFVGPGGGSPRKQYIGSFSAALCNENGTPLNTSEGSVAQNTGTAASNRLRSIAGALPAVNFTLGEFNSRARRSGAEIANVLYARWLGLLMMIEAGSLDTQVLEQGYTYGYDRNSLWLYRLSGRCDLGNGTGHIMAAAGTQDDDNFEFITSTQGGNHLCRDTLRDANGRYAWSVSTRAANTQRWWTDSRTPSEGDALYAASDAETPSSYTVAGYASREAARRVVQFQYRGIANPFGEVWEALHGKQNHWSRYTYNCAGYTASNVKTWFARDTAKDGASSYAWTNETYGTIWTDRDFPLNSVAYSDEELTQAAGFTVNQGSHLQFDYCVYDTTDSSVYTTADQHAADTPVYGLRRQRLSPGIGWVKKFDPATFETLEAGDRLAETSPGYLSTYSYANDPFTTYMVEHGGSANEKEETGMMHWGIDHRLTDRGTGVSTRISA